MPDRPLDPHAEGFPDPVPLRVGSKRLVCHVGLDYYLRRIEQQDHFYFSKINHGVWERYLDVQRQRSEGVAEPRSTRSSGGAFVLEGGFMRDLATDLDELPRSRSFIFGVSHLAFADHEEVAGKKDAAETVAVIDAMLPDDYIPVVGTVFKDACITGEILRLWEALADRDVIVVGPDYLSGLAGRLEFRSIAFEAIHRSAAHEERDVILSRLLRYRDRGARPPVFLVQAGPLSFWLAKRMFDQIPGSFMIDLGIVLNLWLPNDRRPSTMPWERFFGEEFRDRLGVDLGGNPGHRACRERIERLTGDVRPQSPPPLRASGPMPFVDDKPLDSNFIGAALARSRAHNHWTNYGPASLELEKAIADYLDLSDDLRVVMTASGTAALFGLVRMRHHLEGRPVRWGVSAFGFHCTRQGPLGDAVVLDGDEEGLLSRSLLQEADLGDLEGLVLTHLFGSNPRQVAAALRFCERKGLHAIVDAAAAFDAGGREEYPPGTWEVLSFHHTKPWGMGEGGAAIVPADLEDTFRSVINFGIYRGIDTGPNAMNGKMSDLAAAAVMQRLHELPRVAPLFRAQYRRITRVAEDLGWGVLGPAQGLGRLRTAPATPAGVPLLAGDPVSLELLSNEHVVLRKYYRPLDPGARRANALYRRIVSFPCHPEVSGLEESVIADVLRSLVMVPGD